MSKRPLEDNPASNGGEPAPKRARTRPRGRIGSHKAAFPRDGANTAKKGTARTGDELVAAARSFKDTVQALRSHGIEGSIEYAFYFRRAREPRSKVKGQRAKERKPARGSSAKERVEAILDKKAWERSREEVDEVKRQQDRELDAYSARRARESSAHDGEEKVATEVAAKKSPKNDPVQPESKDAVADQ